MMTRARASAAGVLTLLLVSVGCNSANQDAPCHVEGKVTYNGSPVGGGFIYFHSADGTTTQLPIFASGTYTADLKEGTFTVTVDTESLNPANKQEYHGSAGGGAGKYGKNPAAVAPPPAAPKGGQKSSPSPESAGNSGTYVKIPKKYSDKASSNLSVTLKRGKNEYNVPLTD
jgi:hypothetical protein